MIFHAFRSLSLVLFLEIKINQIINKTIEAIANSHNIRLINDFITIINEFGSIAP
jgi:hypothetical protein